MRELLIREIKELSIFQSLFRKPSQIFVIAITLMLPVAIVAAPTSSALGSCEFGYYAVDFDDEAEAICEESYWDVNDQNDGFDRVVSASIDADNSSITNNDYDFLLYVRCTSKKLEVFAASTYELFNENAYKSGGTVQVRFDSSKVVNYKFTRSTSREAIFLNNPKTFSTALSKAKSKVALKFTSSRGIIVLQFPAADFAQSKKSFSTGGCKF